MKTHAGLGDLRRGVLVAFVVSMLVSVGAACSNSSEDPSDPKDLVQDQAGTDLAEDGQDPAEVTEDSTASDLLGDQQAPPQLMLEFFEPYGDDNAKCQGYTDPPDNTQKITTCNFQMETTQSRTFKVILLADGAPVAGEVVAWSVKNGEGMPEDPALLELDSATSVTDADGVASVTATAVEELGSAVITAALQEVQEPPEPLLFNVEVPGCDIVPLEVTFEYSGTRVFDKVDVYLYSQEEGQPACAGIKPWDPPVPADKSGSVPNVSQTIPFMMPDLGPENPVQHYTVLALANDPDLPFGLVMGCDDVEGVVEYGKKKVVTLILHDVAPVYSGTYTVVTHIDLMEALPGDVKQMLTSVVDFLGSPTLGLMQMACVLESPDLQPFCLAMFADPPNFELDSLTETGSAVALVIDTFVKVMLTATLGADILFTAADLAEVLDLRLFSQVTLTLEPDADGLVPSTDASHELQTVSVQWTLGQECDPSDPDCGLLSLTLSAIGMTNLTGPFEFRVPGYTEGVFHEVELGEHNVGFQLGTFLDALIQKVVLPGMTGNGTTGPLVDTHDKFVKAALGGFDCLVADNCCQVFVQEVLQHTSADVQTVLAAGCEALLVVAPPYFADWFLALNSDTSPGTKLATPPATTCEVYDLNGDYIIDYLGSETDEAKRCQWTLKLEVMGNQVETEVSFWGKRAE